MTPDERQLGRVRNRCKDFYHLHGTDAHTVEGMRARATLWSITGKKPSLASFEEVLAEYGERERIAGHNVPLSCGDRESWPNESDYAPMQALCLEKQAETITDKIQTLLLGDKTP